MAASGFRRTVRLVLRAVIGRTLPDDVEGRPRSSGFADRAEFHRALCGECLYCREEHCARIRDRTPADLISDALNEQEGKACQRRILIPATGTRFRIFPQAPFDAERGGNVCVSKPAGSTGPVLPTPHVRHRPTGSRAALRDQAEPGRRCLSLLAALEGDRSAACASGPGTAISITSTRHVGFEPRTCTVRPVRHGRVGALFRRDDTVAFPVPLTPAGDHFLPTSTTRGPGTDISEVGESSLKREAASCPTR